MRSDEDLLADLRRGDEGALVEIYRRHQAALFRFAMHMTGSREIAEEAVQETFLAVIRKPDSWRSDRGAVRSFLFGVARNMALRRAEDRAEFAELDYDAESAADLLADLDREERIAAVRDGVLSLPSGYREVVVLCDLEEIAYDEAAHIMGCPIGTVRSRLSRGRAMLAAKLKSKFAGRTAGRPV